MSDTTPNIFDYAGHAFHVVVVVMLFCVIAPFALVGWLFHQLPFTCTKCKPEDDKSGGWG